MYERVVYGKVRVEDEAFERPKSEFLERLSHEADAAVREWAAAVYDEFVTEYDRRALNQP